MTEYDKAQDQLRTILEESDFSQPSWLERWGSQVQEWKQSFDQLVHDFLSQLFQTENVPTEGAWLFPVLLVLVVLLFVWWISRRLIVVGRVKASDKHLEENQQKNSQWGMMAEKAAARGEYREAMRCLFQSILENLDEQGVINRLENKTNLEYLDEVERHLPQYAPVFTDLVRQFDRAWYGLTPIDSAQYKQFHHVASKMAMEGETK